VRMTAFLHVKRSLPEPRCNNLRSRAGDSEFAELKNLAFGHTQRYFLVDRPGSMNVTRSTPPVSLFPCVPRMGP
jgi:hypothetical protein